MGSFGYWFAYCYKDIFKFSFNLQFEQEITENFTTLSQWFLVGELLSGLIWTYLLKYMSTKFCIILSLSVQTLSYLLMSQFQSIGVFFFCRCIQGFFNNVNSLGKAFVFEFCDVDFIALAFSSKGFLSIVLSKIFPKLGVYVYKSFNNSYGTTCFLWFVVNGIVTGLFFLGFYLWKYSDNTQEAVNRRNKLLKDQEMKAKGVTETVQETKKPQNEVHHGLVTVFKFILTDWNTSLMFVVYVISKAITKVISVYKPLIYLKDENLGGLDYNSNELSNWEVVSIIPSFFILFAQPRLVPKVISYKKFIGGCIGLGLIFILLIPGLADIARVSGNPKGGVIRVIMMINFMFMSLFSAKLYIPAMNVLVNLKMEKSMRAGLNSIFYLGTTLLTIGLNWVNKNVMNYFFDDLVEPPSHTYKYLSLSAFLPFQIIAFGCILLTRYSKQSN